MDKKRRLAVIAPALCSISTSILLVSRRAGEHNDFLLGLVVGVTAGLAIFALFGALRRTEQ